MFSKISLRKQALLYAVFYYTLAFNGSLTWYAFTVHKTLSAAPLITLIMSGGVLLIMLALLAHIRWLLYIILPLIFVTGAIESYFAYALHMTFNEHTLGSIFENNADFSNEFISVAFCIWVISNLIISLIFIRYIRPLRWKPLVFSTAGFLIILSIGHVFYGYVMIRSLVDGHMPLNHMTGIWRYVNEMQTLKKLNRHKIDIGKTYKLSWNPPQSLTIVLILGESARGDLLHINNKKNPHNTPLLEKRKKNLVSFTNAWAHATTTREGIPYILSRSQAWEQMMQETSLISVMNALGFETTWIGAQGISGAVEATYASMAMEAKNFIDKRHLMKYASGHNYVRDDFLLKPLENALNHPASLKFIVLHTLGSHWQHTLRYPQSFARFTPVCSRKEIHLCAKNELLNGYHNTILFTDWLINQVIQKVENQNAIVIYVSDHGFSLGEQGLYCNAYVGPHTPKEQLHIPLIIWASTQYGKILDSLRIKQDKPVKQSAIFHTILSMMRVRSELIDNQRSLVN